jgi:hypothetical protein
MRSANIPEREWVKLTDVRSFVDAGSLEALLQSFDIPVLVKADGAGGYMEIYMGFNNFGVDIYVPNDEFERASEILEAYASKNYVAENADEKFEDESDDDGETPVTSDANPERKISTVQWGIRIFVAISIAAGAFGLILNGSW